MKLSHTLRIIRHQNVDVLKNAIKLTVAEAPQYISRIKEEKKKIMYDKLVGLNKWYTKIIGLDEVKLYQDKVTELQEQLLKTQEKRREVGKQLADVRQKSLELQDEIHKVKRQEDLTKFLDLMKQETEILRLENSISRTFQDYDQMERELFTAFSNAIRDSHEKQRAQLEYTKYFGIILSITGSFLAFFYTTVRKQDLKRFIEEKLLDKNTAEPIILNLVQANEQTMQEILKNRETLNEVIKTLSAEGKIHQMSVESLSDGTGNFQSIPVPYGNEYTKDLVKVFGGVVLAYFVIKIFSG